MPSINVLILCAGRGTRYAGRGNEKSKCLLDLGNELVIDRQLRLFRANGLTDITVVVGNHPKTHKIREQIIQHVQDAQVNILTVDMPQKGAYPNEVYTIFKCQHLLNNTIVLWGDFVFSDSVLKQILQEPFDDVMFIRGSGIRPEVFAMLFHKNIIDDYKHLWKTWIKDNWEIHAKDLINIINGKIFKPKGLLYDIDYPWDLDLVKKELSKVGN